MRRSKTTRDLQSLLDQKSSQRLDVNNDICGNNTISHDSSSLQQSIDHNWSNEYRRFTVMKESAYAEAEASNDLRRKTLIKNHYKRVSELPREEFLELFKQRQFSTRHR